MASSSWWQGGDVVQAAMVGRTHRTLGSASQMYSTRCSGLELPLGLIGDVSVNARAGGFKLMRSSAAARERGRARAAHAARARMTRARSLRGQQWPLTPRCIPWRAGARARARRRRDAQRARADGRARARRVWRPRACRARGAGGRRACAPERRVWRFPVPSSFSIRARSAPRSFGAHALCRVGRAID